EIVKMEGWRRRDYFDRTGLTWVSPSPNLRTVAECLLYPAVGLLEAANVSVGRGTDTPFEVLGAPWVDGALLASKLTSVPGISVSGRSFRPTENPSAGKRWGGVGITVTDRKTFEPIRAGVAIALALRENHPRDFEFERLDNMLVDSDAMDAMRDGKDPGAVES